MTLTQSSSWAAVPGEITDQQKDDLLSFVHDDGKRLHWWSRVQRRWNGIVWREYAEFGGDLVAEFPIHHAADRGRRPSFSWPEKCPREFDFRDQYTILGPNGRTIDVSSSAWIEQVR